MGITYASFKSRFPELADTSEADFDGAYVSAKNLIEESIYVEKADQSTANEVLHLLSAHVITASGRSGSGNVIREKVGDLERAYHVDDGDFFSTTVYGELFKKIRNRVHALPIVL